MKLTLYFKKRVSLVGKHIVLIIILLVTLAPLFWTLITSLKPTSGILTYPPKFIPYPATLEHYASNLSEGDFLRYILNSTIVSFFSVLLVLFLSVHAGYAAARYNFPGKNVLMFIILSGMAIGRISNIIPLYFQGSKLHLLNSYPILIITYSAWISPLSIWLMQGYYKQIPPQLEEAAQIDGCSRVLAFYKVILPVTKPAIVASAICIIVFTWNEFFLAMVFTTSTDMRTLPVGLHYFLTDYGVRWGALSAAGIISIVPILVFFLWLQRYFVQGLTGGTLK